MGSNGLPAVGFGDSEFPSATLPPPTFLLLLCLTIIVEMTAVPPQTAQKATATVVYQCQSPGSPITINQIFHQTITDTKCKITLNPRHPDYHSI